MEEDGGRIPPAAAGIGQPSSASATPTGDAHTAQPERDLEPGNPNLTGAAPPAEKRGIADKVKGMLGSAGGHHHKQNNDASVGGLPRPQAPVFGDDNNNNNNTGGSRSDTKVGCLDRIKGKVQGHHRNSAQGTSGGPAIFSRSSSSSSSSSSNSGSGVPLTSFHLDPTGPPPLEEDLNSRENAQSTEMNGGGRHHRTNIGGRRSSDQSPSAWPRPTNPMAGTNTNGGATLNDHQGHVQEGPRDDSVKKEGFLAKIKEKLHSPGKGRQHPSTPTTTAPAQSPEY